jgi:two-component system response regulator
VNTRVPRLLVVEDSVDDEKLILRAIKRMGGDMEVYVVRDGEEAINYLCGNSPHPIVPDLVLLDWKLPRFMGIDVLKRIRSSSRCKGLAVVAFSSSDRAEDQIECMAEGGNAYVVKPVAYDEFLAAVQGVITRFGPSNKKGLSVSQINLLVSQPHSPGLN